MKGQGRPFSTRKMMHIEVTRHVALEHAKGRENLPIAKHIYPFVGKAWVLGVTSKTYSLRSTHVHIHSVALYPDATKIVLVSLCCVGTVVSATSAI